MLVHQHRILTFDGWYALGARVKLAPLTECTDAEQPVEAMRARQWEQPAPAIPSVPILDTAADLLNRLLARSHSPDWGERAPDDRDHDTITGADVVATVPWQQRVPTQHGLAALR